MYRGCAWGAAAGTVTATTAARAADPDSPPEIVGGVPKWEGVCIEGTPAEVAAITPLLADALGIIATD